VSVAQILAFPGRISAKGTVATITNAVLTAGGFPLSKMSGPLAATSAGPGASVVVTATKAAALLLMFGGQLFEKIIVTPRVSNLEFVLSSTTFPVEVWNTHHDASESLTAIAITGQGGLTVTNPFTFPLVIGPKGSVIFEVAVPSAGDVAIAEDIDFVFTGISGTDLRVTGSRILVFSVAPDWAEGIEETISYLTDVMKMYDDSEQRRGLRTLSRRGLKFRALTLTARNAAGLESLIWGWQHQPFCVPFWQEAQPLTAPVSAGQFSVEVNTVDRLFAVGGVAIIWTDEFTFEALTVAAIEPGSLSFTAPTQSAWAAGAFVVPGFLARMPKKLSVGRNWSGSDQLDVAFEGEAQQIGPLPAAALTQFKSFDVLEVPPNWVNGLKREYDRTMDTLDPGPGPLTVIDHSGVPVVDHELPWWIDTHAKITAFRAFVLARYGQLNPFWCPTWDQDLVLNEDASSGAAFLVISFVNYARFFFPTIARRYLALISRTGAPNAYVEVTGAVNNGNGTETLTLGAPLGAAAPAATTMVSFLTFGRQSADVVTIKWESTEYAETALGIQELPQEIPS
jgi:hypothetical protein